MKPTQEQVIAWALETHHYTDYEDGKDNKQFKVWCFTYQGLQDAFTLAYEAGRKDENEELAAEAESNGTKYLPCRSAQGESSFNGCAMKGITVGYTGWFGWPAVYCRILEIEGDKLRVELREGGEGWIPAADFTPQYFYESLPNLLSAQGENND